MSKGWNVKVETNVVLTVNTNIGVLASTEEQAGQVAQEVVSEYLLRNDYRTELEKVLPCELRMGGFEWDRGSRSIDIDFDSMQSVFVEPDSDFDPEEDEEPMSECCGATLLHYDNGLGLCAECKEWSGPYQDEDEVPEDAAKVRDLMEAAQCLNESFHDLPENHPLKEWRAENGTDVVRNQINLCAIYCDNLHRLMMEEQGYDGCFDFDFCPQFLENCIDHETFAPKSEKIHVLSLYWSGL